MLPTSSALTSTLCGAPSPASTLVSAMPAARVTEVGALVACGRLGADVEDIDDAAPAPRLHAGKGLPAEPDRREQLEVDVVLPHLVADLQEGAALRGAGVVDEHVDLAERRLGLLVGLAAALRRADVGGDADDLGIARRGNLGPRLVEALLPARDDGDVGAGADEMLGDGPADALAAAGDERVASVHAHLHVLPLCPSFNDRASERPRNLRAAPARHPWDRTMTPLRIARYEPWGAR